MSRCTVCGYVAQAPHRFCPNCGALLGTAPVPYLPLQPGQRLKQGAYSIVRSLGAGGMGAVYLATQRLAGRERSIVVKEMLDYYDPANPVEVQKAHQQFEREAATLVSLSHIGIPSIYDYFTDNGRNYIVMEYISGSDLLQGLSHRDAQGRWVAGRPYPLQQVLDWTTALCRVLEYLKRQVPPVVHNDIKPANIILDVNSGAPRLVDFGTARARLVRQPGGRVGVGKSSIYGTQGYAAPEMYRGEYSPHSDVYALAATLYHLLTDDDPRAHPFAFSQMHRLPAKLAQLLNLALAREPKKRIEVKGLRERLADISAPVTAGQHFTFRSGETAHVPEDLVALADRYWDETCAYLYKGPLQKWFTDLNRHDMIAHLEAATKGEPNRDVGLERFLQRLDPGLPAPTLSVTPSEVRFGLHDITEGQNPSASLQIRNAGRGCLHGTVRSRSRSFGVDPGRFAVLRGQVVDLGVEAKLDTLAWGKRYRRAVDVASNGGRVQVGVSLRTPSYLASRPGLIELLGFRESARAGVWGAVLGAPLWTAYWLLYHELLHFCSVRMRGGTYALLDFGGTTTVLVALVATLGALAGAVGLALDKDAAPPEPEHPVREEWGMLVLTAAIFGVVSALVVGVALYIDAISGGVGVWRVIGYLLLDLVATVLCGVIGTVIGGLAWCSVLTAIRALMWGIINLVHPRRRWTCP